MKIFRLLIIEDNRVLRDGITTILNEQVDMHVVATIRSGNNILLKVSHAKPHVILIDAGLKYFKEVSVVESIKKSIPEAKMIGMGLLPLQADIVEFVEAGASGFILKDATVKEFLSTIRSVVKGEKVLPPSLTGSLFSHVAEFALKTGKGKMTNAVRMTKRNAKSSYLLQTV
jgi:DNA-binding NarL/FixJ family response regulator